MRIINKMILMITLFIFTIIFVSSFFLDSSVYYNQNTIISLLICALIMGIWFAIMKKIRKSGPISSKKEILFLIIIFALITLIQIISIKQLGIYPHSDFNIIFDNALNYVKNGTREGAVYYEYFQLFPHNIMMFKLFCFAISVGGIFNISPQLSCIILNIIFIDAAIFLLYVTIKRLYTKEIGFFALILVFFFLPIFIYTTTFYSDTLSLVIPIAFVYVFSFIEDNKINKKNTILFIVVGLMLFWGTEIKITSIFILIALTINYCLKNKIKYIFCNYTILFVTFVFLLFIFNKTVVENKKYSFKVNDYGSIPYTHFIMMGVEDVDRDNSGRNSYGGYNNDDLLTTKSYENGKIASKKDLEEAIKRVKKFGIIGYSDFLIKKSVNIWTDGLYFSDVCISITPIDTNTYLRKTIFNNIENRKLLANFCQGVQYAFIISLMLGSIKSLLKKKYENIDYLALTILGTFVFLLLWEGRSRYIFNLIPIFVLLITNYYYNVLLDKEKTKVPIKKIKNS